MSADWSIGEPKQGFYPVEWNGQSRLHVRVTQPLDMMPKEWAFAWAANEERVLMIRALAQSLVAMFPSEFSEPVMRVALIHYADVEAMQAKDRTEHYASGCETCIRTGPLRNAAGTVRAHARKTKYAADLGTYMHRLVENEVRAMLGRPARPTPRPDLTKAQVDAAEWGVISWRGWANKTGFRPVACELRGFHWDEGYAGTFDALAYVEDVLCVVDWKSSKAVHDTHHIQTGRYYDMISWMGRHKLLGFPLEGLSDEGWILRLPKDEKNTDFEAVRSLPAPVTRPIYTALLELYRQHGRFTRIMAQR